MASFDPNFGGNRTSPKTSRYDDLSSDRSNCHSRTDVDGDLSDSDRHLSSCSTGKRNRRNFEPIGKCRGCDEKSFRLSQIVRLALSDETNSADRGIQEIGAVRRQAQSSLPDPNLIREIVKLRQDRGNYFGAELLANPAWDILLDLSIARAEHRRVSVTSLCIAAGVPPTTALRWIGKMVEQNLLIREADSEDSRRVFVSLSDHSARGVAKYFNESNYLANF